jgi:hypothetical protein
MGREYYFWCIVDRYLSTGHIGYTEALDLARRDVFEISQNKENLEALAKHCTRHMDSQASVQQFSN